MNSILIEVFVLIVLLSTVNYVRSANDSNLNILVQLLRNSQTNCSEFTKLTEIPIYVHKSYPIIGNFITNQTLSVFYNRTLSIVEQFLLFFDYYFFELTKSQQKPNDERLKYFFSGLLNLDKSIKSFGICFNDRFYHSYSRDIKTDYLCQFDIESYLTNLTNKTQSNYGKYLNGNVHRIKWEPVICVNNSNGIRFPIRLVYSFRNYLENKSSIIFFEFNITDFKLDQCAHRQHRCREETTMCVYHHFPGNEYFSTGNYYCRCRESFFMGLHDMPHGFPGKSVEREFLNFDPNDPIRSEYFQYRCEPCPSGCESCTSGEPCAVTYETKLLRGLPLAIQSFCITMCIVTGIIIFQLRRTRVVKNSNWILLELFLLGAILIYCTIINAYFIPSEITCAIQPFLREGGFVLMYGVLYVKVYRVLCSFQSRKAQRVYVRDQDILRYLGVLVIICLGHLIAWVATGFDHRQNKPFNTFSDIRKLSKNLNYLTSKVCRARFWEIVSYLYETGLLAITIYYCKCVKSAPSEYGEVRFVTVAVVNELIISLLVIITRMTIVDSIHPDYIFLIHFIHCHATATISVLLLIGPKMWYLYRPPVTSACKPRLVPHTESHIIQTQQKLNGDVDLVEINLAEMDCETIRDELKRLYTQLEIYKTRAMRKDNPHVSRKRGGRKQRRFSLQHFHKKHHATSVHDDETSKISEDSAGNSGGEEATLTSTSNKQ